jgi:hypothetical protein
MAGAACWRLARGTAQSGCGIKRPAAIKVKPGWDGIVPIVAALRDDSARRLPPTCVQAPTSCGPQLRPSAPSLRLKIYHDSSLINGVNRHPALTPFSLLHSLSTTSGIYFHYIEKELLPPVGDDMAKKSKHMTKNEKLDTLRVDVTRILQAIEKLTHRLDAVILPARKATKKARKSAKRQAVPTPVPSPQTDQDEDDKAASISD